MCKLYSIYNGSEFQGKMEILYTDFWCFFFLFFLPGRLAQSVMCLTQEPEVPHLILGRAAFSHVSFH